MNKMCLVYHGKGRFLVGCGSMEKNKLLHNYLFGVINILNIIRIELKIGIGVKYIIINKMSKIRIDLPFGKKKYSRLKGQNYGFFHFS